MEVKEYFEGMELAGYISNMPEDVYHNTAGFTSKSSLVEFGKCTPFRFFNQKKKEPSAAMKMGTALHCAILEPAKFASSYLLAPELLSKSEKEYKEFAKLNPDFEIINGSNADNLSGMIDAVNGNDEARELLSLPGFNEVSGFYVDPDTGIGLRHRFDRLTTCGVGVDLKKTQSVKPEDISKAINDYGYHIQDALYSDAYMAITGRELNAFYFIFVEEKFPHQVAVVYLDDISKQVGRDRYRELLIDYIYYRDNRHLVNNNAPVEMVSLPEWALRKYEQELEDGGIF